jgi:soluble lytic murein transglycosylase-like protein
MTADILNLLNEAAARYGVPADLVIAQASQESGGNQYDSHGNVLTSSAGAMGVMQLMPATAADLGVDATDAAQNIDGGVRYLSQLLKQFNGDTQLALAAYNWGPGHVARNGLNNWPTETVNYVSSILAKIGSAISGAVEDVTGPSSPPIDGGSSGGPGTGGLLAMAIVGGLVLWALTEGFRW